MLKTKNAKDFIYSQNHERVKVLAIIFLLFGLYNLIIDFSSLTPWDEKTNQVYKIMDLIFVFSFSIFAMYFWFRKFQNPSLSNTITRIAVIFGVYWSVFLCGFSFNSIGFSTYLGSVLLALLYLNFNPVFSTILLWTSSLILVGLVFLVNGNTSDAITIAMVMFPINTICTFIFDRNYREKLEAYSYMLDSERLATELSNVKSKPYADVGGQFKLLENDIQQLEEDCKILNSKIEKFSLLINNLEKGVLFANSDGAITYINDVMLNWLGELNKDDMISINIFDMKTLLNVGFDTKLHECISSKLALIAKGTIDNKSRDAVISYKIIPVIKEDTVNSIVALFDFPKS